MKGKKKPFKVGDLIWIIRDKEGRVINNVRK